MIQTAVRARGVDQNVWDFLKAARIRFYARPDFLSSSPGAVLDDAACQSLWKVASPDGDTLSGDMALPYIVNFQMVDTDEDGKISDAEFKTACGKGWVQSADASTPRK